MTEQTLIYEMPGRTELIGNHSDHQGGLVISSPIDRCIHAEVTPRDDRKVVVDSEGHPVVTVDLDDLKLRDEEKGTATALVRGAAKYLSDRGFKLRGFTARTRSDVPAGSGMSSSAAFEVLVAKILTDLADRNSARMEADMTEAEMLAQAGFYAEYEYYGKPCGLQDQLSIASGEPVLMDFADPDKPLAEPVGFDPERYGYRICLVQTGADHADLAEDYAAIVEEMKAVAAYFGKKVLHEVDPNLLRERREEVLEALGERPVLRAEHFFEEQLRVRGAGDAMRAGDMDKVLELIKASGLSSAIKLQNIVPANGDQTMKHAIDLSEQILDGAGLTRVHGGGFAGTIQAFVPQDMMEKYVRKMNEACGAGACLPVSIVQKTT